MLWILILILHSILEFFPVSSSTHLILIEKIFAINLVDISTNNFIFYAHLITSLAIVAYFYKFILKNIKNLFFIAQIFIATIPSLSILFFEYNLTNPSLHSIAYSYLLNSFILFIIFRVYKANQTTDTNNSFAKISLLQAFIIGSFQLVAIIPGISRLAITVLIALIFKNSLSLAIRFSLIILIIPSIGSVLFLTDNSLQLFSFQLIPIILSCFFVAVLSLKLLLIININIWRLFAFYSLVLSLFLMLYANKKIDPPKHYSFNSMGTECQISIWDKGKDALIKQAMYQIESIFYRIESSLSTYKQDNEISTFNNKLNSKELFTSSNIFAENLLLAKKAFEHSNKLFDITIHPLITLWKKHLQEQKVPSANKIQQVLQLVDFNRLKFLGNNKQFTKTQKEIQINFGGIAKGYAVDKAKDILNSLKIEQFLINFGASSITCSSHFRGNKFKVGIFNPIKKSLYTSVTLSNKSISTSGGYNQFTRINNQQYSHIFHPLTGKPIQDTISCSVITDKSVDADFLSTTFFIMDKSKVDDYYHEMKKIYPNLEVLIFYKENNLIKRKSFGKSWNLKSIK